MKLYSLKKGAGEGRALRGADEKQTFKNLFNYYVWGKTLFCFSSAPLPLFLKLHSLKTDNMLPKRKETP